MTRAPANRHKTLLPTVPFSLPAPTFEVPTAPTDRVLKHLTHAYVVGLTLIAFVLVAGFWFTERLASQQEAFRAVVNLSGLQRTLSQRMVLYASLYGASKDAKNLAALSNVTYEFEAAHRLLIQGDVARGIPTPAAAGLQDLYFKPVDGIDPLVQQFVAQAKRIGVQISAEELFDSSEYRSMARVSEDILLAKLNAAVLAYDKYNQKLSSDIDNADKALTALLILVLLTEGLLVYRPLVRRVKAFALSELKSRTQLTASLEQLKSLNILIQQHAVVIQANATGHITAVNEVFCKLSGFDRDALKGQPIPQVDTESDAADFWRRLKAGQSWRGAVRGQSKTGETYWLACVAAPIELGLTAEPLYLMICNDIIETKQAAEKIAHERRRLQNIIDGTDVGTWEWNVATGQVRVSRRWAQMLGLPAHEESEFSICQWEQLIDPAQQADTLAHMQAHLAGQSDGFNVEVRMRHESGHWLWIQSRAKVVARNDQGQPHRMSGTHMDITARKTAEIELQRKEERFQALTYLSSDWYWEQDASLRYTLIEGPLSDVLGDSQSYMGQRRWDNAAFKLSESDWAMHRQELAHHKTFLDFEIPVVQPDGRRGWYSVSGSPIFDAQGQFTGYRGVGSDITHKKDAAAKIEKMGLYDELTGLGNRHLLARRIEAMRAVMQGDSSMAALLLLDLDHFKDLNDTRGHAVGDELLVQVALRLKDCVRDSDTVARLGGDEFVVLLHPLGNALPEASESARAMAHKVANAMNTPYELSGHAHKSSPSIGVKLIEDAQLQTGEILKHADMAMYQAKSDGRNRIRFFDAQIQSRVQATSALEQDLGHAIAAGELRLHYQPVVDLHGVISGYEALVRWLHPEQGLISPGLFIPVAERTDLILTLGHWVLQTACLQLARWAQVPDKQHLTVAVNLSARQVAQFDLVPTVTEVLAATSAPPDRLKLELTESLLQADVPGTIEKMRELTALGIRFSLDDFGTGYSSLSYLKRLPLSQLKIDQSFVRDLLTDPDDAAIARMILQLANSLEMDVVAEGVETQGQADLLKGMGCTAFQGYFFGRPAPL